MNYPTNQFFLGGDSNSSLDLETKIQALRAYEEKLRNQSTKVEDTIWTNIDNEINSMNDDQKVLLFEDSKYLEVNTNIQLLVQNELLNLVKNKIENSEIGNKLLKSQLEIVRELKNNIIKETNREMEIFKKFKDFSKNNPGVTYEEFIKASM